MPQMVSISGEVSPRAYVERCDGRAHVGAVRRTRGSLASAYTYTVRRGPISSPDFPEVCSPSATRPEPPVDQGTSSSSRSAVFESDALGAHYSYQRSRARLACACA